jgi:hypothetical protein
MTTGRRALYGCPMAEPLPANIAVRGAEALEGLGDLNAREQLEAACRIGVGILAVTRSQCEPTPHQHAADDALCGDLQGRFSSEIAPLRLMQPD